MSKKRDKEEKKVKSSKEFIYKLLQDKEFLEKYGRYIKFKNVYINTKIQEVIYSKSDVIDVKKYISEESKYLYDNTENVVNDNQNAIHFLVPLSAVIAVEQSYHSNRVIVNQDLTLSKALSVTVINGINKIGKDNNRGDVYLGISYALLSYRSTDAIVQKKIGSIYQECVGYLNDFITAYKLVRHDHTVNNVTIRTLPSFIEYYEYANKTLSDKKIMEANGDDLADIFSKRLPKEKEFEDLKVFAELLPTDKTAHYIVRIGERSIRNICLGEYEDAIINSDRFAEFVLRDVLRKTLNLSSSELSTYKNMYSTVKKDLAVVQVLANKLNCKGNAIISEWFKHSRLYRNKIVHSLDVESIEIGDALKAVEYNMKIVNLMISKSSYDFDMYKIIPDTYSRLFLNGKKFSVVK